MRWLKRLNPVYRLYERLYLSYAKHPSLTGHPRMALRLSKFVRAYSYPKDERWVLDGAPPDVVEKRQNAVARLAEEARARSPKTHERTRALLGSVSDLEFVNQYRVPFQFRNEEVERLSVGQLVDATAGVRIRDLDGQWHYDLGGSYGVNLFGFDFYKACIQRGVERASSVGVVLGPYLPDIEEVVARLQAISRLDEVSFHMSGTEAVMQAVRLARFHTKKRKVVRFCGAYHGWWDGVQVGPGNPLPARDVLTLTEMSEKTLHVLKMRDDIACVLVNPLQALTPNQGPANDSTLILGRGEAYYEKDNYSRWLRDLQNVCTEKGIALIFDEVFLGFRLAKGGAQEYFGIKADLVAYGKTLGGGLPVGVLCGTHAWMKRFHPERPADMCFARGTFNSHPYVIAAMAEFLRHLDSREAEATWSDIDTRWNERARRLNRRLAEARLPMRVANMTSVFVTYFTEPGRYYWLWQYYLRQEGLSLSWIGSARFIFSHDYTEADFDDVIRRIVRASEKMSEDGWLWQASREVRAQARRRLAFEMVKSLFGFSKKPDAPLEAPPSSSDDSIQRAA